MTTHENADQTSILADGAAKRANGNIIEPLKFLARRDVRVTELALQAHKESLANLAKKTTAEGYADESRLILDDANAIEYRILPQLRAQRELPLTSVEALEKQVGDHISGFTRRAFAGLDELKTAPTKATIKSRRDQLQRELAAAITTYVRDVAQAAYSGGYAARTTTPESLAAEHIARLGGRAD